MRITFDHQIFGLQEYGGISRYFCELAARLQARPECAVTVLAGLHRNAYLRGAPVRVQGTFVRAVPHTGRARLLANELLTAAFVHAARPAIVHETYYGAAARRLPARTRRVLTVYDMIHERHPESFPPGDPTAADKAAAVRRADHVVCISEATRADLVALLGVAPSRTSVVHLGLDHEAWAAAAAAAAPGPPGRRPYLLFVGQRGGYKNFALLLEAVAGRPALAGTHDVVCFGGGTLTADERGRARALGLAPERLVQLGGDDRRLAGLYRDAAAFVYPSRMEGFGLPPLEAMACGCPVVSSTGGSLAEVVGEAAERFDADDAADLAAALERVVASPERAAALRALGAARVRRFTWDRCANETLALYRRLHSS